MSVSNGQPVSAAYTNPAFLKPDVNDFTVSQLGCQRPTAPSGYFVQDIQRYLNNLAQVVGLSYSGNYTAEADSTGNTYGSTSTIVANGVTFKNALIALMNAFSTSGHAHTGSGADGAQISLTAGVTGVLGHANGGTDVSAVGSSGNLLTSNGTSWVSSAPASPSGAQSIGTYDSQSPVANALQIISTVLYAQSADATHPGMVSTTTQTFAGNKTFNGTIKTPSALLSGSTSGALTHTVPATVTSYSVVWPSAQGGATTYPQNDGSGNLSWVTIAAGAGNNYYSGYMAGMNWSTGLGTFVDPTNSGGNALTQRKASGLSVSAGASNVPGITFTPSASTAVYQISASMTLFNTSAGNDTYVSMTDGSTVIITGGMQASASTQGFPLTLTGIFVPGTGSAVTVKLQMAVSSGTGTMQNASGITGSTVIEWSIIQMK